VFATGAGVGVDPPNIIAAVLEIPAAELSILDVLSSAISVQLVPFQDSTVPDAAVPV
jgi:hypothetical protein